MIQETSAEFLILLGLAAMAAHAQASQDGLHFDVASVKHSPSDAGNIGWRRGGPGTATPSQIRYTNLPLRAIIVNAYALKDYQLIGPGWIGTERYDIVANVPPGTTKEDLRIMLRNLLAQRFGLAVRREMREMAGYDLVIGKGGQHLAASGQGSVSPPPEREPPPAPKMGKDGFLEIPPDRFRMPGIQTTVLADKARIVGYRASLSQLASALESVFEQPVSDRTGLDGRFDFILSWTRENGIAGPSAGAGDTLVSSDASSGPLLFTAIEQQLGLKLQRQKQPLEVLIIEHAEKIPSAN